MNNPQAIGQISDSDLYASKIGIGLARSQKILQSWSLAKPDDQSIAGEDNDGDFRGVSESAGLGAAANHDDDGDLPEILRSSRISQDKLLEQMIGKKAAQERKRAQENARRSATESTISTTKTVATSKHINAIPPQSDDEDEGESRAATFSSRKKRRDPKTPAYTTAGGKADDVLDPDAEPPDPRTDPATVVELVQEQAAVEEDTRPKKRKAGSYLDELLAQKAKKKNRKKKIKDGVSR